MVVDVQRGGPSTGLPTKTEQADLLQAMFGRNGEAPVPIVAPQSPGDCFDAALEAVRIAVTYRTPVMLLSDGYLANGSEPWRMPERRRRCPTIDPAFATAPNHVDAKARRAAEFWPYLRDAETLARPWAIPGTPGLEHRIGGLEKADGHGNISYDPANHDLMVRLAPGQGRADRRRRSPPLEVDDPVRRGAPRCWCWAGARRTARSAPAYGGCARPGYQVAQAHLRHLNPFPRDLGEVLRALRQGARPRDEPRPARAAAPRPSTWSTPSATTR